MRCLHVYVCVCIVDDDVSDWMVFGLKHARTHACSYTRACMSVYTHANTSTRAFKHKHTRAHSNTNTSVLIHNTCTRVPNVHARAARVKHPAHPTGTYLRSPSAPLHAPAPKRASSAARQNKTHQFGKRSCKARLPVSSRASSSSLGVLVRHLAS